MAQQDRAPGMEECPICGGEGLGWGCDGCGRDGGLCKLCHQAGAPGGCFGCGRDLRARRPRPTLDVVDDMILEETPAKPPELA